MIDSVRLILPNKRLNLKYEDRGKVTHSIGKKFQPDDPKADEHGFVNTYELFSRGNKEDLKINGRYHPRLSERIDNNGHSMVTVEFSLPKFEYGSNLFEFDEKSLNIDEFFVRHFYPYCKERIDGLHRGVDLFEAEIVRIDFSKNILLKEKDAQINWIIEQFALMNMKNWNCTRRDYYDNRLHGKSAAYFNTWFSFNFYNKLAEVLSHRDKTKSEKSIYDFVKSNKVKQVIRFEASLQNRNAIKLWYENITGKQKERFRLLDFWNTNISKRILLGYLKDLHNDEFNLFTKDETPRQSMAFIQLREEGHTVSDIKDFLFLQAIVSELGPREAYHLLQRHIKPRTLSNHRQRYEEIKSKLSNFMPMTLDNIWREIENQINEFKLVTPDNFKGRLLITE